MSKPLGSHNAPVISGPSLARSQFAMAIEKQTTVVLYPSLPRWEWAISTQRSSWPRCSCAAAWPSSSMSSTRPTRWAASPLDEFLKGL